ncbi:MAG: DUF1573 domain-containing protein [Planctomycetes bacterium]|nr:DUF1573 domain-containing protein [Planctomycetota bacterium]
MSIELKNWKLKALLAAVLGGSVAVSGLTRIYAEDTKPAQPADTKAAEVKPAQVDPHAGHDHGPAPVGPPAPGAQPGPVKPMSDIPTPTVTLKPGEVPAIKFDTPIYDFGKVKSGTDIKHDFYFTNTGTGPLELLRVKPSCGCTVAGQHDRIVQPGQTGKIPITLSSKNASGPISKSVTVNTNIAGTDSTISLQIKGEVWQPIQVTPQAAAFGRITSADAGEKLIRKLTIVNNLDTPVTLGEPTANHPKLKATIATLEEGKKYELTVMLMPPLESGNTSGKITIPTGVADSPTIDVQAYAFVTAAVDVTPTSLTLPPTRTADLTRQFYVRSNVNKPIKITELASTNPAIKLELTDVKDAMTYRLKVDVPMAYTPTAGGDKITFKTDSPEVPLVTIPVTVQGAQPTLNPMVNLNAKRTPMNTSATGPGGPTQPANISATKEPAPAQPVTTEVKKDEPTKG